MNAEHREWLFRVVSNTEAGRVDVDYLVDTLEEAHTAIKQGPFGLSAVRFLALMRNDQNTVPTIEALALTLTHDKVSLTTDDH